VLEEEETHNNVPFMSRNEVLGVNVKIKTKQKLW